MCVVQTFWDECPNYALIQSSEMKAWKASLEAVFLSAFGKGPYRRCITEQGRNKKHTNYPSQRLLYFPHTTLVALQKHL